MSFVVEAPIAIWVGEERSEDLPEINEFNEFNEGFRASLEDNESSAWGASTGAAAGAARSPGQGGSHPGYQASQVAVQDVVAL